MIPSRTWHRSSNILRQQWINNLNDNSIHEEVDHVLQCDDNNVSSIDSMSSTESEGFAVDNQSNELFNAIIGSLIVNYNLSKHQMDGVIKSMAAVKRRNLACNINSIDSFWSTATEVISREYWFICKKDHSHGPYHGSPSSFSEFQCCNQLIQPKLTTGSYFIQLSIKEQLIILLPLLTRHLLFDCDDHDLHDIRNASLASEARADGDSLTLTLFTDEVPASKSSKISILPIYLMINELTTTVRKENAILCAVYVGASKPSSVIGLLNPLIDELKSLESDTLSWICKRGNLYSKKFKLICIIADAPMRAYLRCVKQYNAKFGCDWCKVETVTNNGITKFPFKDRFELDELLRTKAEFLEFAQGLNVDQACIESIKNISPFLRLCSFDIVWGFSIDIMHAVYIGVVKDIFKRGWFNNEKRSSPYFLGQQNKIKAINERIKRIKVCSEHTRRPRNIDEYCHWKANEFGAFLCYLFAPILDSLLPYRYLAHLGQLSEAICILQAKPLQIEDIERARIRIEEFIENLEILYGYEFMTYNAHILSHLSDAALKLGPACNVSAFISENYMGKMKKMNRKFIDIPQTLCNLYSIELNQKISLHSVVNSAYLTTEELTLIGVKNQMVVNAAKGKRIANYDRNFIQFCEINDLNHENARIHRKIRAGHINSILGFSEGLKAAGHEVCCVHREKYRHMFVEKGFSLISFDETLWNVNLDEIKLSWLDVLADKFRKDPVKRFLTKSPNEDEAFKNRSVHYDLINQALDRIISDESVKFDAIIVDFVSPSPPLYKNPILWFPICSLNPLVLYPAGPPPFSGYSVNSDKSNWDEFRKIYREAHAKFIEAVNADLDAAGLKEARFDPLRYVDHPQTIGFYHYPAGLDYTECGPIESNWHRVESFIRQPDADTDFVMPEHLRDKPGKLIYFSLGSLGSADLMMLQKFINILAKSPHKFIISKGPRGDQLKLADNMWGENFVNQLEVIQSVDLVITHGGNNTFMETLYYGKPMIVFPYFYDQFDNAQRVVDKKIGFRVNPYDLDEDYFLDCIEKVFADKEIKNRVEAISQSMRNSNSLAEAIKMIEKQIERKKNLYVKTVSV